MLVIPKFKALSDGLFVPFGRTEFASFATDTKDTVFKLLNDNFDVEINGEKCEVRECRVSKLPFNRPWPGKQRQYEQTESAGYISFYADEAVTLKVKSKKAFSNAKVRPLSKNVVPTVSDDEITLELKEFGSYVLELDGTHNVLHIFFNEYKEYPDAQKSTYYFGPGIHFPMMINLKDNDTVYVDKEAIVFGSIFTNGAKNVKIYGGGVIDNSCEERLVESSYEPFSKGTFRIYNAENVDVSDLILVNSSNWVLSMFWCRNITIDNVKIVGHWRYNTDGIDIVNSSDITIKNSFIRSFDDTISIKAIYGYDRPIENITVDNCVLWSGWNKNCEVGVEACGVEYKNIRFRNSDLIHSSLSALSVSNGGGADMHDIVFEGLNIEFQNDTMMQQLQTADSQEYTGYGLHMEPKFVFCSNMQYATRVRCGELRRAYAKRIGTIRNIRFDNVNVIAENIDYKPQIYIESVNKDLPCTGFHFNNLCINGIKQTAFDSFELVTINSEDITIS